LIKEVAAFCSINQLLTPGDRVVVAVSGGADSVALLHLLLALRPQFQLALTVAHLNHNLRGQAASEDAEFVAQLAGQSGLPLVADSLPVADIAAQRRQSLEETARQVRYAFLWRAARQTNSRKIAVGHHAGDQAETILMHLLRGSGPGGLQGMLPLIGLEKMGLFPDDVRSLPAENAPRLIRPLLNTPRNAIHSFCQAQNLPFRQDASNRDTSFFRNRIRHQLIPSLETYNPNIQQGLLQLATILRAEAGIIEARLQHHWEQMVVGETATGVQFDREQWNNLPLALRRAALRRAIARLQPAADNIGFQHIERGIAFFQQGRSGATMSLPHRLHLRINYGELRVSAGPASVAITGPHLTTPEPVVVNLSGITPLPDTRWQLISRLETPQNLPVSWSNVGEWEAFIDLEAVGPSPVLRTRQPGDLFCPIGMSGRKQKLKDFMINQKIPAEWRPHIPLLVCNGEILWVCGHRMGELGRITAATQQMIHFTLEAI
jgi:tRNA(Ile)-lysidine synthase